MGHGSDLCVDGGRLAVCGRAAGLVESARGGLATAETLHTQLATQALQMAVRHRQPPRSVLHHSDRGVPYASGEYRGWLAAAGLEPSMSRAGNPYDNAAMESFNATYKRECVGLAEARGGYATRAEATDDFFNYVEVLSKPRLVGEYY